MKTLAVLAALSLPFTLGPAFARAQATPDTVRATTMTTIAEQVRAAEAAFAATMAARDHEAFGTFLDEEAVFFGGQGAIRGKAAVMAAWKKFYEGEKAPFSWEPRIVEVLDSGTLALSSGPVRDPSGKEVAAFNSIWRLNADGQWKVVFDKGSPVCDPEKP